MAHDIITVGDGGTWGTLATAYSNTTSNANVPNFKILGGEVGGLTAHATVLWTSTAVEPVRWYAAAGTGHNGTQGSGDSRITSGAMTIRVAHAYVGKWDDAPSVSGGEVGEGFRIARTAGSALVFDDANNYNNLTVDSMLIEGIGTEDCLRITCSVAGGASTGGVFKVRRNSFIRAAPPATASNYGLRLISNVTATGGLISWTLDCYNNTAIGQRNNPFRFQTSKYVAGTLNGTLNVKNCTALESGLSNPRFLLIQTAVGNVTVTATNNLCDDTSATDAISTAGGLGDSSGTSKVSVTVADTLVNVTAGSYDVTPKAGSLALLNGTAISGIAFDAIGTAIVAGYEDIGSIQVSTAPVTSVARPLINGSLAYPTIGGRLIT